MGIALQHGARVSEIIGVRIADVILSAAACVHLHGKGRKQRTVAALAFNGQRDSRVAKGQSPT